jgi:hypothetical protein
VLLLRALLPAPQALATEAAAAALAPALQQLQQQADGHAQQLAALSAGASDAEARQDALQRQVAVQGGALAGTGQVAREAAAAAARTEAALAAALQRSAAAAAATAARKSAAGVLPEPPATSACPSGNDVAMEATAADAGPGAGAGAGVLGAESAEVACTPEEVRRMVTAAVEKLDRQQDATKQAVAGLEGRMDQLAASAASKTDAIDQVCV